MSRLVTIDCTASEIRIAVGSKGLTGVSLDHVVCCPLELGENEDLISSPKTLEAMQALLKRVGVKSGEAVVCIGRGSIELRALSLPTIDKNELPEMVRFAAQRHFANVGDNWPIDFVTMPSSQENMTECLAASMNPALIERVHKVLETCGLTLTQLVLRPMASATMAVVKQPQLANSVVLFLDIFRDEADMAVMENGHVVFMRNVRFAGSNHPTSNEQILIGEIKRTMIAAASQRPDLNVEQIRIWGDESQHADLCQSLSQSLKVPASSLDPFPLFDASPSVRDEAGSDAGKYAATLGALLAGQVTDRLIDFSHPRKRIEKTHPIRMYAIAGLAAASLVLGGVAWYWTSHSELDSEIAALNEVIKANEEQIKAGSKNIADWTKVEKFLKGDHPWLDELEYLSVKSPNSDKAIFSSTTFTTEPLGSSTIATQFVARERDDIPEILAAFSDPQHVVRNRGVNPSKEKTNQQFPVVADLVIKIPPVSVSDPRIDPSKPATKPASKSNPPAKLETKPETKPETNPTSKPEIEPETKPEIKPGEPAAETQPSATAKSPPTPGNETPASEGVAPAQTGSESPKPAAPSGDEPAAATKTETIEPVVNTSGAPI